MLLIERDEDTRAILTEVLVDHGYTAVPVPSGPQAIEYLSVSDSPCMVVLDVDARDEAVEFLRWLHDTEHLRGLRVVVTSGWRGRERRLSDFRDNIAQVLHKPLTWMRCSPL